MSFSMKEPQVGNLVAHERQPVDAETEGEAGPRVGVDPDGGEDGRVDHAAAAELHPPGVGTRPASRRPGRWRR